MRALYILGTHIRHYNRRISTFSIMALFFLADIAYAQSGKLENPLAFNTIAEFVAGALQALVVIALPIVGFFIVLSGFMFISSRGDSEGLAKAKQNFVYVIIGSILILGAWALAQLIGGTIEQLRA